MPRDEFPPSGSGGKAATQAYWNALSKLRTAWRTVFNEELEAIGSRGKEAFENGLESAMARLRRDDAGNMRLRQMLDVDPQEEIVEVLLQYVDLDDFSPKVIKQAMLDECRKRGRTKVDVELRTFLRSVLDDLFDGSTKRRPNVGSNRHWPRLLQYLRELEEQTDWSPDGRGIRLANIGGRGPVAREPRDPGLLRLIIDPDHL